MSDVVHGYVPLQRWLNFKQWPNNSYPSAQNMPYWNTNYYPLCCWSLLSFAKLFLLLPPHGICCVRYRTCFCHMRFLLPHLD